MDEGTAVIVSSLGMLITAGYQLYAYTTGSPDTERLWLAGVALVVMLGGIYFGIKTRAKQNPR